MIKSLKFLFLLLVVGSLSGCTEVVAEGDLLTLKSKAYVAVLMPLMGILLIVGGISICIKRLPEIWNSDMSMGWKGRRSKIVVIPIIGVLLLLAVAPRMLYRVEVGPDFVNFREVGNSKRYDRDAIAKVLLIEGISEHQRRLQVMGKSGEPHFINESEIGTESFDKMVTAIQTMRNPGD